MLSTDSEWTLGAFAYAFLIGVAAAFFGHRDERKAQDRYQRILREARREELDELLDEEELFQLLIDTAKARQNSTDGGDGHKPGRGGS